MNTDISTLKAHLSDTLRRVKAGEEVIVLERKTPIARILPFIVAKEIEVRKGTGRLPKRISRFRYQGNVEDLLERGER